jgi:hypothetical protein
MMREEAELRLIANRIKRIRRFPRDAQCETCGTTDYLAWTPDGAIRCYQHIRGDAAAVEADHLAGRANIGGLTMRLDANAHRRITEIRAMLGLDAWPPAGGDPLLVLAHLLGGIGTLLILVADWLVELALYARQRLDHDLWADAPPSPIA